MIIQGSPTYWHHWNWRN